MSAWFREGSAGEFTLTLHIQPGAKKTEIAGLHGDALKIRLAAPPVDGKANATLIDFIADRLNLPKSRVEIKTGHSGRRKVVGVAGASSSAIQALLNGK